ncbi:hypothetical protein ACFY2Q_27710 [Micromonospora sp. NPDC000316]|uniref:hypothetical protein n=1 Tax=Micromonospora sp. NPDC000316 TaxID=3364216 RepID=UPI0036C84828
MHVVRLVRAAITAAAGAVVTLAQLNLPNKELWARLEAVQWVSVIVVTLFLLYDAFWAANQAVRARQMREYDADLRAAISSTVTSIVDALGVRWDEVSVQYYRSRRLLLRPTLVRVTGVRAGARLTDAGRSFRPGVGLVGTAFAEQVLIAEQWRDFFQTATRQGPQAWKQRAHQQRYGLSWGQLRRSGGHDGAVASPTFAENGRPNGCIMISGPLKEADLVSDEMGQIIDSLATTLDQVGPPPAGWWSVHA